MSDPVVVTVAGGSRAFSTGRVIDAGTDRVNAPVRLISLRRRRAFDPVDVIDGKDGQMNDPVETIVKGKTSGERPDACHVR